MNNFKWTPLKYKAAFLLATEPKKYYQIADMLGVTVQTLWNYRQYPEFTREIDKIWKAETQEFIKKKYES